MTGTGYDSMNRMPGFEDEDGNATAFQYADPDGRRSQVAWPFPAGAPVTTNAAYDIVGARSGAPTEPRRAIL